MARSALAGARGLHLAGWQVDIGSPTAGIATRSRAVREWIRLPPLESGSERFVEAVRDALRGGGHEVVFAAGDAELLVISEHRERLGAVVPHPPHPVLLRGLDKLELMDAARDAGLEVPETWEAGSATGAGVDGAVIVKPRLRLASGGPELGGRLGTRVATSAGEVREFVSRIESAGGSALIQERLGGVLTAWSGVRDERGNVLAEVQQDALRLWPPGGGVSARAVTVPVSPEISAGARALLERLSWSGLVQLQFIRPADGRARLIDLNPRFYGSLALAIGAGVNLPAVWAAAATGREAVAGVARVGERYQWLTGDLQAEIAGSGRPAPGGLFGVLRWAVGARHSVFKARDPLPAVWYLAHLLRVWTARRRGTAIVETK